MMKIYLVRHGKPAFSSDQWSMQMNTVGYAKFMKRYRHIGITPDQDKAMEVARMVPANALFLSSDLKRAVQTAIAITGSTEIRQEKIFREVSLPIFRLPGKAKCARWWRLSVALRYWGLCGKMENNEDSKVRVEKAAKQLAQSATDQDVVLFGHGFMNYFIAKELARFGWQGAVRSVTHWDVLVLTKNG
jgi:broad specificity phosphatase PhoE